MVQEMHPLLAPIYKLDRASSSSRSIISFFILGTQVEKQERRSHKGNID